MIPTPIGVNAAHESVCSSRDSESRAGLGVAGLDAACMALTVAKQKSVRTPKVKVCTRI